MLQKKSMYPRVSYQLTQKESCGAYLRQGNFVKKWLSGPAKPHQAYLDLTGFVKRCFLEPSKPHQAYLDLKNPIKNCFQSFPKLISPIQT